MLIYMLSGVLPGIGYARFCLPDLITRQGLELLAEVGLALLLFKVGLESDIKGLRAQLPNASWIWIWDVLVRGSPGFTAACYLPDYSLLTSVLVCAAQAEMNGLSIAVGAFLIGLSRVPRAEIAMVVMHKGMDYSVAPGAFAAMLIVSATTILLTALLLPGLLQGESPKRYWWKAK